MISIDQQLSSRYVTFVSQIVVILYYSYIVVILNNWLLMCIYNIGPQIVLSENIQLTVSCMHGDRLQSSIYFYMKTMIHKLSNTFTDLWTKSNMYASPFFTLFVLVWLIRFYILFHNVPPKLIWIHWICNVSGWSSHIIMKRAF